MSRSNAENRWDNVAVRKKAVGDKNSCYTAGAVCECKMEDADNNSEEFEEVQIVDEHHNCVVNAVEVHMKERENKLREVHD